MTTLSRILAEVYECTVLHMDDFFLQPHQRTALRLAEPGGNVDRERFLQEVLLPLSRGESLRYRPFNCGTMELQEPVTVNPGRLTVIEGAYSMHPELEKFYDLSVFLSVSPQLQRERILRRNGEQWARRFFEEWIPMEQKYFDTFGIPARCALQITIPE